MSTSFVRFEKLGVEGLTLDTDFAVTPEERDLLLQFYYTRFPDWVKTNTRDLRVQLWKFLSKVKSLLFSKAIQQSHTNTKRAGGIKAIIFALAIHYLIVHKICHLPGLREVDAHIPAQVTRKNVTRDNEVHVRTFAQVIVLLHGLGLSGKRNKELYLQVGAMLEGSGKQYTLGGTCSACTMRRFEIYASVTESHSKSVGTNGSQDEACNFQAIYDSFEWDDLQHFEPLVRQ